jgi:hypothetical protein
MNQKKKSCLLRCLANFSINNKIHECTPAHRPSPGAAPAAGDATTLFWHQHAAAGAPAPPSHHVGPALISVAALGAAISATQPSFVGIPASAGGGSENTFTLSNNARVSLASIGGELASIGGELASIGGESPAAAVPQVRSSAAVPGVVRVRLEWRGGRLGGAVAGGVEVGVAVAVRIVRRAIAQHGGGACRCGGLGVTIDVTPRVGPDSTVVDITAASLVDQKSGEPVVPRTADGGVDRWALPLFRALETARMFLALPFGPLDEDVAIEVLGEFLARHDHISSSSSSGGGGGGGTAPDGTPLHQQQQQQHAHHSRHSGSAASFSGASAGGVKHQPTVSVVSTPQRQPRARPAATPPLTPAAASRDASRVMRACGRSLTQCAVDTMWEVLATCPAAAATATVATTPAASARGSGTTPRGSLLPPARDAPSVAPPSAEVLRRLTLDDLARSLASELRTSNCHVAIVIDGGTPTRAGRRDIEQALLMHVGTVPDRAAEQAASAPQTHGGGYTELHGIGAVPPTLQPVDSALLRIPAPTITRTRRLRVVSADRDDMGGGVVVIGVVARRAESPDEKV